MSGRRRPLSARILSERWAFSSPIGTMSSATCRVEVGLPLDLFTGHNLDLHCAAGKDVVGCLPLEGRLLDRRDAAVSFTGR
jgi:hypothetical protein